MAGSLDSLVTRKSLTTGVVGHLVADAPVAIRLKFKRKSATSSVGITSITTTTAVDITVVYTDATTSVWDFATYDTVGKLVDKINSEGYFEAKVLDTLRAYATTSQFVDGAISAGMVNGVAVWDVKVDTSVAFYIAYRLSPTRRSFSSGKLETHRAAIQEVVYYATVGTAAIDSFQIWDCYKGNEDKVYSAASVKGTKTTVSWTNTDAKLQTLGDNHELVVVVKDAASLADSALFLRVVGEIE